jgi:membrane protein
MPDDTIRPGAARAPDVARLAPTAPALRVARTVVRGFHRHELSTRAAALTYGTLFSLVPTLAVAFAMFKAFGGMEQAREVLLPHLLDYLAVGSRDVVEARIDEFIANVHGGAIGGIGTVMLLFGVTSLMSAMEGALDRVWDVPQGRSFVQRATMYWTTVTVTPTLLLAGATLPATVATFGPLAWLGGTFVGALLGWVLPLLLIYLGFAALYTIVPNTRVPVRAAVIGAIVGGTLWFAAVYGYAFYAGVSVTYSRMYGSLGALAVFLVWIYLTWLIVLVGAEVAAAVQSLEATEAEMPETTEFSAAARELVALRVLFAIVGRFVDGRSPATAAELGEDAHLPPGQVAWAVRQLAAVDGVIIEDGDGRLTPARDPRRMSPAEVLAALRRQGRAACWHDGDAAARAIEGLDRRAEEARQRVWAECTLAQLALGTAGEV